MQVAKWEADDTCVSPRESEPGAEPRGKVFSRSGKDIFAGELLPPPINATTDILPTHNKPEIAIFQGRSKKRHYNLQRTTYSGCFTTLLNSLVGCAVYSTLSASKGFTTLEPKVNMLRAHDTVTPLIHTEGELAHAECQVSLADGQIVSSEGKTYEHATTKCQIFDHTWFTFGDGYGSN